MNTKKYLFILLLTTCTSYGPDTSTYLGIASGTAALGLLYIKSYEPPAADILYDIGPGLGFKNKKTSFQNTASYLLTGATVTSLACLCPQAKLPLTGGLIGWSLSCLGPHPHTLMRAQFLTGTGTLVGLLLKNML